MTYVIKSFWKIQLQEFQAQIDREKADLEAQQAEAIRQHEEELKARVLTSIDANLGFVAICFSLTTTTGEWML